MTFNAEELESIYERVSIGELFSLESCMDKKDIHQLLEYFANRGIFHQFMACYIRYANHELILNDLLKNASDDLLASIATDRLTPISTLKLLENERSETVRSHAKLNLLRNALGEGVGEKRLLELISEHSGDEGISIAVRQMIASSKKTPHSVLRILAEDDVDCISKLARKHLSKCDLGN